MSKEPNVIVSNEPWQKSYPNIDKDNEAFYDGLKRHQLLVWRCKKCGASYWPKAYCQNHENEPFAANMDWAPASGTGKIFAFNRHHMAFHPAFKRISPPNLSEAFWATMQIFIAGWRVRGGMPNAKCQMPNWGVRKV